ncbi:MAG: hypothetical protein EBQ58_02855 [Betaproteobacteria bacterium]|nr:hypothetical protein [Betaproteobacteria bacterium]
MKNHVKNCAPATARLTSSFLISLAMEPWPHFTKPTGSPPVRSFHPTPLLEKFNMLHEMTTPVAQHAVQTKRLDDIPELGDVDFMKLDVQGSELSVLQTRGAFCKM